MKRKIILEYGLKFLLSLFLVACILSGMIAWFTTPKSIWNLLEKENYVSEMTLSIQEEMKNYINQSGLPENVLDGIFHSDDVERELIQKIESITSQKRVFIETDFLQENLSKNIDHYLHQQGVIAEEESLNRFIEQIAQVYEEEMSLYHSSEFIIKCITLLHTYALLLLGILFGVCLCLMWILRKKGLSLSFYACSIFLSFFVFYLNQEIDIAHLYFLHSVFSNMLQTFVFQFFQCVNWLAISCFGIGLCLSVRKNYKEVKASEKQCN